MFHQSRSDEKDSSSSLGLVQHNTNQFSKQFKKDIVTGKSTKNFASKVQRQVIIKKGERKPSLKSESERWELSESERMVKPLTSRGNSRAGRQSDLQQLTSVACVGFFFFGGGTHLGQKCNQVWPLDLAKPYFFLHFLAKYRYTRLGGRKQQHSNQSLDCSSSEKIIYRYQIYIKTTNS